MFQFYKKHIVLFLFTILVIGSSIAQEGLRPMTANINYLYPELNYMLQSKTNMQAAKSATGSINLPFFDDFYYASRLAYPDQQLWSDSLLYINTGMAKAPLTVGVATFDGLNKYGFPYNPNLVFTTTQANAADTLTSHPINLFTLNSATLQPSDSVALIFYYQLTGNGDSPEIQDSLMLDFYKPAQSVWNNKTWALRGNTASSTNDTIFKRAFVWVTDTAYFHDGFKFRFRNKAASNGNYDNWHLDHVLLDKGRSIKNDTAWNDLTIGYVPTSFLKSYSAMPWQHFTGNDMATRFSNFIRYNGTSTVNTTYSYEIYDKDNALVNSQSYGASNLPPFKPAGWQHYAAHRNPSLTYTFATMTDSMDFTIKHYMLNLAGDVNVGNDTVFQKQQFRNYFAYDDGSCETGYYIVNSGSRMAQKYQINVNDTLRALRIYFDPIGAISTYTNNTFTGAYKFKINVYTDGGSGPGINIFTSDSMYPRYSQSGHNKFAEYKLNSPLVLSAGNYYIGIQQYVASGITIGFDMNYNSNDKLYYNIGNGWTQSGYKGSLMMRPVFGKKIEPPVGLSELQQAQQSVLVYPNPANDQFTLQTISELQNASYAVYSITGAVLLSGEINSSRTHIQTSDLHNGVYFLIVRSANNQISRHKIIIQH